MTIRKRFLIRCCIVSCLGFSPAVTRVALADWEHSYGMHDLSVPEMNSDTFGVNITLFNDYTTDGGVDLHTAFDVFLDHDKDHLDPDHIPIWWMGHFEAKKEFYALTPSLALDWLFDVDTKANTVSSVERQIKAMPGIAAAYTNDSFSASIKGSAGWYFLEIDDDVAKNYGYTRNDYRNSTSAASLAVDVGFSLGNAGRLSAFAGEWADGGTWLEKQYGVTLSFDTPSLRADSKLVFESAYTEFNLVHYVPSEPTESPYPPILPWDHDVYYRLSWIATPRAR